MNFLSTTEHTVGAPNDTHWQPVATMFDLVGTFDL